MNRDQIIKEVLVRMDEVSPLDGINVIPNPIVEKVLDESARNILLTCPSQYAPLTPFVSALKVGINSPEVDVSQIRLPEGFLRLIRFRLDKWTKATNKVIQEGSDAHRRQFQKYTLGGSNRPAVCVVNGDLGLSLEYYYKKGTAPTVVQADCVVETKAQNIPDILLVPLFWNTASMAFQILSMGDQMNACMGKVKEQYQILTNNA